MAYANLNQDSMNVGGKDSIVVTRDLCDLPGGITLDVSDVASGTEVLKAGHVVYKTSGGVYKPVPVSDSSYSSISDGDTYIGVLKHSILVSRPMAAVLTVGQVNAAACPYPVTSTIKSALVRIDFIN